MKLNTAIYDTTDISLVINVILKVFWSLYNVDKFHCKKTNSTTFIFQFSFFYSLLKGTEQSDVFTTITCEVQNIILTEFITVSTDYTEKLMILFYWHMLAKPGYQTKH